MEIQRKQKNKLHNKVLRTIRLVVNVGSKLGALPILWDNENNEFCITNSKLHLTRWFFVMWYIVINSIFMTYRLIQATCCMNVSYGRLFLNLFSVVTFVTTSGLGINTFIYFDDIPIFINRLIRAEEYFQRVHMEKTKETTMKDTTGSASRVIVILIYSYSFSQLFGSMKSVDNPKYFYSLMNLKNVPKWKLLPIGIFESLLSASAASVILFYLLFYLVYVKSTKNNLRIMGSLEAFQVTKYYRIIQLLNMQFNQIYQSLPSLFTTGTCLIIHVISSYATFRLFNEVQMPAFLGFPMTLVACSLIVLESFPTSYEINAVSEEVIQRARLSSNGKKVISKSLNSCRPVGIHVSNFYIIKRSTTFMFFDTAFNQTMELMLTF